MDNRCESPRQGTYCRLTLNLRVTQRTFHSVVEGATLISLFVNQGRVKWKRSVAKALTRSGLFSANSAKAAPKSRLQVALVLLGLLGGLGRLARAGFARC